MSGDRGRVGRSYTAARRHPWVLGKLGDWRMPLGPYTAAQLVVAFTGALLLIKTFAWWSWLGPIPVVVWGAAIWAVRGSRIAGRSPFYAAFGLLRLAAQPRAGRIRGRAARDRRPRLCVGAFGIEVAPAKPPRARRRRSRRPRRAATGTGVPRTALQQLLASTGGGR